MIRRENLTNLVGLFFYNDEIVVVDRNNHRVQVLNAQGEFLYQFGAEGNLDHQLNLPLGISIDYEGNFIVADSRNKSIKVFSSRGYFLRKIGTTATCPFHCIQDDNYHVLSDYDKDCVEVLNVEGAVMCKFGAGYGDREFNSPDCLSVTKAGHLIVCDGGNHRQSCVYVSV